jgi:hypothetical protein
MTGAWDTLLYGAIEGIAIGICYTLVEKYMLSKKEPTKNPCAYLKQGDRQCGSAAMHDVTHCIIPSPQGSKVQNKYVRFKLCDFHYKKFIVTQTKSKEVTKPTVITPIEVKKELESKTLAPNPQSKAETPDIVKSLAPETPKSSSTEVKEAKANIEVNKNETKS